jgi:hypothetical protein
MLNSNEDVLQYEILQEKAQSLGLAARQIQNLLEALKRHDQDNPGDVPRREELLADVAERAYFFKIQRELCGFRDWDDVVEFYAIPPEVLKRMGKWREIQQPAPPSWRGRI